MKRTHSYQRKYTGGMKITHVYKDVTNSETSNNNDTRKLLKGKESERKVLGSNNNNNYEHTHVI